MILVLFVYGSFDKTEEAKLQGQYSVKGQYKPAKKECFMSTHSVELFCAQLIVRLEIQISKHLHKWQACFQSFLWF